LSVPLFLIWLIQIRFLLLMVIFLTIGNIF
jgi:hypothetical protein